MEFSANKPIYRQIIDYCFGKILTGVWLPGEKVSSVREMSVELAVNTHTVLKAYEYLQERGIIISKRGMGFFLSADAPGVVNAIRREEFYNETLPQMAREMRLLGITADDLISHLNELSLIKEI